MNQTNSFSILVGILVLTTTITGTVYAEKKIEIFSLDSQISTTDDILVTGFVNADSSYKPVRLEIYYPNGELLYRPDVYFNGDGQFSWLFHPPLGKFDVTGTYTVIASHEEISETAKLQFTVNEIPENPLTNTISKNPTQTVVPKSPETSVKEDTNAQESNNNPIQTNSNEIVSDYPMLVVIVVMVIAAVVAGIVIWIRATYEKPLIR